MKNFKKGVLITLVLLLLLPFVVSAKQDDFANSNLIIFEDKTLDEASFENITVVGGNANIQTDVDGSIIVVFGKATINGNVSGDVVSVFGELDIKATAQIQGNLVSIGKLEMAHNSLVTGTKLSISFDFISLFKTNGIIINTFILFSIVTLAIGLILISIFTKRYRVMAYSMKSGNLRRIVIGLLLLVSATIVLVFFIFLIAVPITYILLIIFADIVTGIYIGSFIFKNSNEKSTIFIEFFVGHIMVSIFKIVPLILLPGGSNTALMIYGISVMAIECATAAFGIGTIIDTSFGKDIKLIKNAK